ncbi:MAG: serine O-acetyltransferase [Pseudomonadota bacterium]
MADSSDPRSAQSAPGFWQLVREDYIAHRRDWTTPGFQALLVYRFGVWRMGIRPKLLRAPFSALYRALYRSVRNLYGIELPYNARIGRRVVFEHQHGIVIHAQSVIGDDCILRQGVTLGLRRLDGLDDAPILGRGVNVGAGAKILGRVHVGDHAVVGANAVVLNDVAPGALVVGVPARPVARENASRATRRAVSEPEPG